MTTIDQYYRYLNAIKTFMEHHGRDCTFLTNGPTIPSDSPYGIGSLPQEPYLVQDPTIGNEPESIEVVNHVKIAQNTNTKPLSHPKATQGGSSLKPATTDNPTPIPDPPIEDIPPPEWDLSMEEETEIGFMDLNAEEKKPNPLYPDVSNVDIKNISMVGLERLWEKCQKCGLSKTRNKMVFGNGAVPAKLMFIGEGPGGDEDRQGIPFVGKAGQLLTKMIVAMGFTKDEVYITNIVKCRPPQNRDPNPSEMLACVPVLHKQIELVKPRVIVTLGRIAAQTLLSSSAPLGRLRGQWQEWHGIDLLPTYHPAYLLRTPSAKGKTWEDLKMVISRLEEG